MESIAGGPTRGDGDGGGGSVHRNSCLRVKAAFATRAAIPAGVVLLWWKRQRLMGGFGPSCDHGNGGGGLLLVRVSLPYSLRKWDRLLANISDAGQISEDLSQITTLRCIPTISI